MFRRTITASACILVSALTLVFSSTGAYAAATSSSVAAGNGMRISPVLSEVTIKPGTNYTINVYVENLTGESAEMQGIVDDFTAGTSENGSPAVLLNGQKAPSHSLKGYVHPIANFVLPAKGQKIIPVVISIPKGLAGGGYYGVVRFAPVLSGGGKNVSLTASAGSLILVTVPGKIVEQMDISSFDVRHVISAAADTVSTSASILFTTNKKIGAVVAFENTGNLQEGPFGNIILKKGTKDLATYAINNVTPRGVVLPDSIRQFVVPLTHLGSFGRYTIEGNFGYGTTGQLLSAQTSFYIVPLGVLIAAGVLVLLILFAIFGLPRLIRAYNRRIINKASRRK